MLGPNFLVSHHTPADCPDYCVVTTLQDCISLLVIVQGFSLVDVPLDVPPYHPLSRLSPGGFSSRLIINGIDDILIISQHP